MAVAVLPVGTCLGMFYPYGVSRLVERGRGATVIEQPLDLEELFVDLVEARDEGMVSR